MPPGQARSFTVPPTQRDRRNVVVVRPTWTSPYTSNLYFSTRQRVSGGEQADAAVSCVAFLRAHTCTRVCA